MLHTPDSLTTDSDFSLALAIQQNVLGSRHVALTYKDDHKKWWVLHLGWYHELHHKEWDQDDLFYWVAFEALVPELAEALADQAVLMGNRLASAKVPYSIVYTPGPYFDEAMDYVRTSVGEGLTCSTFILAVFHRFGMPLLDESTWPRGRPGDARWGLKLARAIYRTTKGLGVPVRHFFEQIRQRWDLRRFRPEEVCASASIFSGGPLAFDVVEPLSKELLKELP
ncbi:hypothetical protein JJB11_12280 [Ramlibacter ginsenosidimutans]|uniref:Uncharacterized protein n=1 Tax=Ramlibacter ginsenosidimutans TaxID=502333 RepID=A0A934TSR8_9BURK|nr:hypothetical protein [Ramlibacter ginsenosidimutans]MBK6006869.1 hypothetical protein [Ramlibacter ginsenosidimutans]